MEALLGETDKESGDKMIANITRTIEELKEAARAEGRMEAKEEDRREGRMEAKLEIAIALLDILDDEIIATKTKLSLEKVKALREESLKA